MEKTAVWALSDEQTAFYCTDCKRFYRPQPNWQDGRSSLIGRDGGRVVVPRCTHCGGMTPLLLDMIDDLSDIVALVETKRGAR